MYKPTQVEVERKNRIKLCVAAYAYEWGYELVMCDSEWDSLAKSIRPQMSTGHEVMDKFFAEEFDPFTGMWIRVHPEYNKLEALYKNFYE